MSTCALRPPPPPHLASPSALLALESSIRRPLYLTKRDGKCLFDQLHLPQHLQKYMGRPPVRIQDLVDCGVFTFAELQQYCRDDVTLASIVHPVSTCLPMGFSWSSFICQSTMLGICEHAGLRSFAVLADDTPAPARMDRTFALATDDVMVFT